MTRWAVLVFLTIAFNSDLSAAPRQFLWRVANAPAPFYIVGSMHALREEDYPTDLNAFNRAIDQTQKFIYERDPRNNDPTDLWRKLNRYTTYPKGVTIEQRVSPSTFALLKRIARIPPGAYETQKPWAIAAFNLKATGMDAVKSKWSMDHYIFSRTRHRESGGLETIDEFVQSFASMNDRESESFFLQAVEYGQRSPELLYETIAAWKAGSPSRVYQLYAPRRNGADGYWRWIERRTGRWIPRIEEAIKSRKPTMVIVGALHIGGPRGVIADLERRGYKLEQL